MTPSDVPAEPSLRAPRVGLDAVARHAGVSVATASRALAGGAVRPDLLRRVEEAVRVLGYRPDLAAQAVARGATRTVALIVDSLRSPFGVEITRGVVDAAARRGLVVNVSGGETHPGDLLEMITTARALRPQCLVLATGRVQDPVIRTELIRALQSYQRAGGSVAIVDGFDLPFASFSFDEYTAVSALCRALVELGYRRPLVFNSSAERGDLSRRTRALIDGFSAAGIDHDDISLTEVSTSASAGSADEDLLELGDADVVVCVEGTVIPAIYRLIRARGLRVGADVGVTAFGQYTIAHALRPHLSTVELPLRRAGELALEHALTDTGGDHLSLPGVLRLRASTPRRSSALRRTPSGERPGRDIGSVAIVVQPVGNAHLGTYASAFLRLAHESGRRCIILTESSLLAEGGGSRTVDALVVCGPLSDKLATFVTASQLACVVLDAPSNGGAAYVSMELGEGVQRLLEHLYELGHTRLAYVSANPADTFELQRMQGIEFFLATHPMVSVEILPAGAALEVRLAGGGAVHGITAVVTQDERFAREVMRRLAAAAVRVPEDVSVAALDGAEGFVEPVVTSVVVDVATAARSAWRLLTHAPGEARALRADIVIGGTTGPRRAD